LIERYVIRVPEADVVTVEDSPRAVPAGVRRAQVATGAIGALIVFIFWGTFGWFAATTTSWRPVDVLMLVVSLAVGFFGPGIMLRGVRMGRVFAHGALHPVRLLIDTNVGTAVVEFDVQPDGPIENALPKRMGMARIKYDYRWKRGNGGGRARVRRPAGAGAHPRRRRYRRAHRRETPARAAAADHPARRMMH
jgi:hypothetical protein